MNRRIFIQVTTPALVIGLLLFGACLLSAWIIHRLQTNMTQILSENVSSLEAAQELEIRLREMRFYCFIWLVEPNDAVLQEIKKVDRSFQHSLENLRRSVNTPEGQADVRKIEEGYRRYQQEFKRLQQQRELMVPKLSHRELAEVNPIRHISQPCEHFLAWNKEAMNNVARESNDVSWVLRLGMIVLGLGGPLSGLIVGYGIARGLSHSIYQLSVRVQDVAQKLGPPWSSSKEHHSSSRGRSSGVWPGSSSGYPHSSGTNGQSGAFQRRGLGASRPSKSSGASIARSAEDQELTVSVSSNTDIAFLDRRMQQVVLRVQEVVERLQTQQREMIRAQQLAAVGQLAASVAHEVRNPLMSIKMLVEASLRREKPKPFTRENLAIIREEVVRLEKTVQGFLDFARPSELRREPSDLRDVVAQAAALVRTRARQQRVPFHAYYTARPVIRNIDRGQLCTVLVNLFLNALDAMPDGGCLEVHLELCGRVVELRVSDTGKGIAEEIHSQLFTPFVSTKPTGTGLGLCISRRIVEEHGGELVGTNRPEGGACFTIRMRDGG